jgi:hypothetical protein
MFQLLHNKYHTSHATWDLINTPTRPKHFPPDRHTRQSPTHVNKLSY